MPFDTEPVRIRTTDDLGGIASLLFKFACPIALIMMVSGFALDLFFEHQMFQRFGALLVGLGVLHYFRVQEIEANIRKYEQLHSIKVRISRFLPYSADPEDENYKSALNVLISLLRPQLNNDAPSIAKLYLDQIREEEVEMPKLKLQLRYVRRVEILMVIVGTFVWAFGDLLTNFLFHCGFNLSC